MNNPSSLSPTTSSTLREACADLVRRLRLGDEARSEHYLETFPALAADAEAAVELIYTEFVALEEAGRRPQPDDFLRRFPQYAAALTRQFDIHRLLGEADGPGEAATSAAADDERGSSAAPRRLGAYEIVRPLGRGGMGLVYLATHGTLGRPAAVKLLHGEMNRALADRFRNEVRSAAALGHPGIVQLYELGETSDGRHFAAFELVEGGSLRDYLAGRPRAPREAAQLVHRLAEALDCAHRAGIVHCDLTPANILLTRDGAPKIADFGLARLPKSLADAATPPSGSSDPLDAAAGADAAHLSSVALAGTPGYLAPERIDDPGRAEPAADLYGLGAVFYELLTGRPPHMGATPLDTLRQARDYDPPSPRTLVPSIPHDAATICLKCLERDPARRYASAAALADDLRRFLAGEPIAARPVGAIERAWKWAGRHRALAASLTTAAVALVALAVGGTWYGVELGKSLDRTRLQERQISGQAKDLALQVRRLDRSLYTMQLNQAEALVDRAPQQALALLYDVERCPPTERDFAWGYLVRRASQDRRTFAGHQGPVAAAAVNSQGKLITVGLDDTLRVWNLADGALEATLAVATADAAVVALSPDGSRLVAAYADGSARLWNFAGGAAPRSLIGPAEPIVALTFFNGGRWLAAAAADGHIRIWDPAGAPIADWPVAESGEILALAAAADEQTLVLGLAGGGVRWIDSIDGRTIAQEFGPGSGAASFSVGPDGKRMLAVDAATGRLELWSLDKPASARPLALPEGFARLAALSPKGDYFAYATADQLLRIVKLAALEVTAEYRGHTSRITSLTFLPDGSGVVSTSDDRSVKVWDVPGVRLPQLFDGDEFKTWTTTYSHDGTLLAAAGADGVIRLHDPAADPHAKPRTLAGHAAAVRGLAFLPGDKQLLSCAEDNTARLWDVASGKQLRSWDHGAWVVALAVDARGEAFYTGDAEGRLRRYRLDEEKPALEVAAHTGAIQALALSPDDDAGDGAPLVASAARDEALKLYDARRLQFVAALPTEPTRPVHALAFAPRGRLLAAGDDSGCVTLWDVDKRAPAHVLRGHSGGVYAVAFTPDGRLVASASGGRWIQPTGEVKLWDVESGQVHATLDGCSAPIAFRQDGRALAATLDARRKTAVWPATPYALPAPIPLP